MSIHTREARPSEAPRAAKAEGRRARAQLAREDALRTPLDPLRERVAAPELAAARGVAIREGLGAALALASAQVAGAEAQRARFDALARDVERDRQPAARAARIADYLRETVHDRRALRADLRALRAEARAHGELRGRGGGLDLAALSERSARAIADAERAAEAAAGVVRVAIENGEADEAEGASAVDPGEALALAQAPGAWSRRAEALLLLRALALRGLSPEAGRALETPLLALAARAEHRWVQPAAVAALAAIAPRAALAVVRERLADPGGGDDFLVRERLLDLAARGVFGAGGWDRLAALACADPSEHVRVRLARGERDRARLARVAAADASHRVRATALIALATRDPVFAEGCLLAALGRDAHGFVVQVAAEEIADLARRGHVRDPRAALAVLARATRRAELDPAVRAHVGDALVAASVHTDPIARDAHALLSEALARTPVGGARVVRDPLLCTIDEERLARVLATLADGDHGVAIDRRPDGVRLHRGEARAVAAWRVIHELFHPAPAKRQGFAHTLARAPRGALRAPPSGLAELTATQVPGERVVSAHDGAWGRALPLVDDLLSIARLGASPVTLATASGLTRLVPPPRWTARLRARASLVFSYGRFAELRRRALDALEPAAQRAYVDEIARVTGIEVRFEPHRFGDFGEGLAPVAAALPLGLAPPSLGEAPELRDDAETPAFPRAAHEASAPRAAEGSREGTVPKGALPALFPLVPTALAPWLDGLPPGREAWDALLRYAASPQGNRLPHLAAYATVVLSAFLIRAASIRRAVDADRAAVPLVIGGWGTRGKSGTERLKAALFQGLGHEALVKTTGCEAMFIHAIPGVPAREIFIYRPYDKATVWEQRDLLELARRLRVRVFLWECMALQPDLVALLQAQWMRDDYSTITNAYPDHEDVQGPTGHDVATVIAEFVPTSGNLFTTEEQMLPLLRDRARARGTRLRAVPPRDAELIPADLLARFPYQEHPRNVALVAALAQSLGVPPAVAIAEMADHVVPDLGVLKTYAEVPHLGRTLSFANGMSANERTGALGNWQRCGFDRHDPDREPAVRVVTVVNNREDRVARSEVFARFLAEDVAAHAHFVIGTNVGGFLGFLREALARQAEALSPTRDLGGDGTERLRAARARLDRAFARVKIGRVDAASAAAELAALGLPRPPLEALERLLTPTTPGEAYEAGKAAIAAGLGELGVSGDASPHVAAMLAGRRAVRAVQLALARDLGAAPAEVDRVFRAAFEAIFWAGVIPIHDAATTGDQILHAIAEAMPPGARVRIMGVQNIKGTGLDFVYRWVSIDAVAAWVAALGSARAEEREDAARALALHGDYGLLDAELALSALLRARERERERVPHGETVGYEAAIAQVQAAVEERRARLGARRGRSLGERARGVIGRTFDYLDSMRRRRLAGGVLDALVAGRLSHAGAARGMREILARARGGWLTG